MSAATMLACSANRIVMGRHSFLGPIDPQFIVQTDLGRASVAAHAIEEQFALAKEECRKQPGLLPAWVPILKQYGPALIVQCQLARQLSEDLVGDWLARYMLNGAPSAQQDAKRIAVHSVFSSSAGEVIGQIFVAMRDLKNCITEATRDPTMELAGVDVTQGNRDFLKKAGAFAGEREVLRSDNRSHVGDQKITSPREVSRFAVGQVSIEMAISR